MNQPIAVPTADQPLQTFEELLIANRLLTAKLEETEAKLVIANISNEKRKLQNSNYYLAHRDEHKNRVRDYQKTNNYRSNTGSTSEQRKIYNRAAYEKRKEKLRLEKSLPAAPGCINNP